MSAKTGIQWTDATWNPVRGCSRVSEGCRNCYAEEMAARFSRPGQPFHGFAKLNRLGGSTQLGAGWTGRVELIPSMLTLPLRWRRTRRVFVNSMSDLFHEKLPDEAIDKVFAVMACAPQHIFQVLTKRPERMRAYMNTTGRAGSVAADTGRGVDGKGTLPFIRPDDLAARWPLPNVHLGVSVEDQQSAEARIPELLQTAAAVRFVSYEPALGPVDFTGWMWGLNWIIVGGESGRGARPFDVAWARSTVKQCRATNTPFFMKQTGAFPYHCDDGAGWAESSVFGRHWMWDERIAGELSVYHQYDRKGGDPAEWPEDLRVREFPYGDTKLRLIPLTQ